MKYQAGEIGRVIVIRFDDGDAVLDSIVEIAKKENIRAAVFYLVGGIKDATIVVGPETEKLPSVPVWREIKESHETLGVGTIFWQGEEPKIHLHGAFGKRDSVRAGCLRESAQTFLVLEGVIMEMKGINAVRNLEPKSNMVLLDIP